MKVVKAIVGDRFLFVCFLWSRACLRAGPSPAWPGLGPFRLCWALPLGPCGTLAFGLSSGPVGPFPLSGPLLGPLLGPFPGPFLGSFPGRWLGPSLARAGPLPSAFVGLCWALALCPCWALPLGTCGALPFGSCGALPSGPVQVLPFLGPLLGSPLGPLLGLSPGPFLFWPVPWALVGPFPWAFVGPLTGTACRRLPLLTSLRLYG